MQQPMLPCSIEAERCVLGAILIDPAALAEVVEFLKASHFYRDGHRTIYEAMVRLYEHHQAADAITVCDELARTNTLDQVGGIAAVNALVSEVPTSGNVEEYARIVERTAIFRQLIAVGSEIAGRAYRQEENALDYAEEAIYQIGQGSLVKPVSPHDEALSRYINRLEAILEQSRTGVVSGVPTGYKYLDRLLGGLRPAKMIVLAARPGAGKCLPYWTLIDDPLTGERLTLEECIRRRQSSIYGLSEEGKVRTASISDWIDSGVKPCYRVRTKLGRMVETTGHHPFLTVQGWKPLYELTVGSHIAIPRQVPVFGALEDISLDFVRLLAYFIAEGGLTDSSPEFTNTDPVIIEDFKKVITTHFPELAIRQEKITYIVSRPKSGGRKNPLTQWLREMGIMGKLAKDKFFPHCVWKWSRRYLAEFIRILMSCDGSIYLHCGSPEIEFTVASPHLASDLYHAFVRFGIVSKLFQTSHGAWRVAVTDRASIKKYQEEIGWIGEKSARYTDYVHKVTSRGGNNGHAPRETWEIIRAEAKEQGLSLSGLAYKSGQTTKQGKYAGYHAHTNQSISRNRLSAFADALDHPGLRRIASPDIYWDEIVSIEYIGEHQVYDLTVPDGANFIAQDVFVHNTALALNIASNAVKQGHQVLFFSLEMDEEELMQRWVAMEAGIDSTKLRDARLSEEEEERVYLAISRLAALDGKLWLDDTCGLSVSAMRSKARRLQTQHGLDLIIMDYLQLGKATVQESRKIENRRLEVEAVSRDLKGLAREVNVPVFALAQLSRAVESRADKVPQLSDLRETGCLTGDALIYLPDEGVYQRMDALMNKETFRVLALNTTTWKLEPKIVTRAFSTGRKPVYKLITRKGLSIRATGNHKFLSFNGWKRLDEIALGTHMAVPRALLGPLSPTMSQEELALLGHLIGDGCTLPKHAVQYTSLDEDLAEMVAHFARQVFGEKVAPRIQWEDEQHGRRGGLFQVYLAAGYHLTHGVRNPAARWLDSMGIYGLRSYEKHVPSCIFAQPAEGIACFLRHLWSTDGHASCKAGPNSRAIPRLYYATSSIRLATDVQALLLRLGINARVLRIPQGEKGRDQFHIRVSGKSDVDQFITTVGIVGRRKQAMLEQIRLHQEGRVENTNRDVLPHLAWRQFVVPAMAVLGMTARQMQAGLGGAYSGTSLYKKSMGRERALRVATVVQSEQLATLAQSDVYWDEVVSIATDGEEDVYDLTVDEYHNFVANNIIVHNSIEMDADVVMFIHKDDKIPRDAPEYTVNIMIEKHRSGPVGIVPLHFMAAQTRYSSVLTREG